MNRKGSYLVGGLLMLLAVACFGAFLLLPPYLSILVKILVLAVGFIFMIAGMGEMMRET